MSSRKLEKSRKKFIAGGTVIVIAIAETLAHGALCVCHLLMIVCVEQGLKKIFTNLEILLFLWMMFVCGVMWGFVETFLFVFLKVATTE